MNEFPTALFGGVYRFDFYRLGKRIYVLIADRILVYGVGVERKFGFTGIIFNRNVVTVFSFLRRRLRKTCADVLFLAVFVLYDQNGSSGFGFGILGKTVNAISGVV